MVLGGRPLLLLVQVARVSVVVVPGRHGGGGGQAGDPRHPGAGRGVDGRVVTGDERRVVDRRTPHTAANTLLHVGEWEIIDVAGDTGCGQVRMLLLKTGPGHRVIMIPVIDSSLDIKSAVLVKDGSL